MFLIIKQTAVVGSLTIKLKSTHLNHIVDGDSVDGLEDGVGQLVRCCGQSLGANLLQQRIGVLDGHQVL